MLEKKKLKMENYMYTLDTKIKSKYLRFRGIPEKAGDTFDEMLNI